MKNNSPFRLSIFGWKQFAERNCSISVTETEGVTNVTGLNGNTFYTFIMTTYSSYSTGEVEESEPKSASVLTSKMCIVVINKIIFVMLFLRTFSLISRKRGL